jgi:DNA-binding NarL/FixJ family response regulator
MTRLLIVDDEEAILFGMKDYFEALGYEVDCARQKDEALLLLSLTRYAVLIADLRMRAAGPNEGLELAGEVKRRWPVTRTVILTAYGSPEAIAEARRLGVDAVLHKQDRLGHVADVVRGLAAPPA